MNNKRHVAVFLAKTGAFQWVGSVQHEEDAMAATHHAVGLWEVCAEQELSASELDEYSLTLVTVTASQAAELELWAKDTGAGSPCPVSAVGGRTYTYREVLYMISPGITPARRQRKKTEPDPQAR